MKRRLFVCFLAMTMLLSLTACGASSKTAASVDSSANDHPAESPAVTEEKGDFDADTNGYDDEGRDSGGGASGLRGVAAQAALRTALTAGATPTLSTSTAPLAAAISANLPKPESTSE